MVGFLKSRFIRKNFTEVFLFFKLHFFPSLLSIQPKPFLKSHLIRVRRLPMLSKPVETQELRLCPEVAQTGVGDVGLLDSQPWLLKGHGVKVSCGTASILPISRTRRIC